MRFAPRTAESRISFMTRFSSQRAAKEYLIGQLVAEAEREGKPLSEIERKMLYFSETGRTLPGIMEVNSEFERDYDNDEYERKICGLGQAVEAQLKNAGAEESGKWHAAIEKLAKATIISSFCSILMLREGEHRSVHLETCSSSGLQHSQLCLVFLRSLLFTRDSSLRTKNLALGWQLLRYSNRANPCPIFSGSAW